ncbi:glutathione S-transferase family protein [Nostocaceae cyanobacterium CENA357]|uniref:Glutathione S-transferase family protein n=1 Tax=Atlanticothrix silvestris CENA357 TaxID=1725252 RepID=A0A8J7L5M1_9CYAN|nr:glutathione S-transferase family protein [Atlanticothrix silvestris]MBH8553222.1 glutathione S-transferase family protein [Atlanticothrix silvestris CENA357]
MLNRTVLGLHPHQKVPVLVDGEVTIFESAAICAYLADKHLEMGFAPPLDSPERAFYHQWLFYADEDFYAKITL